MTRVRHGWRFVGFRGFLKVFVCWGPAGRSAHVGQEEVGEEEEVQQEKFSEKIFLCSVKVFPAQRRRKQEAAERAKGAAKAPRAQRREGASRHEKNPEQPRPFQALLPE